jgi:hypothetical protein
MYLLLMGALNPSDHFLSSASARFGQPANTKNKARLETKAILFFNISLPLLLGAIQHVFSLDLALCFHPNIPDVEGAILRALTYVPSSPIIGALTFSGVPKGDSCEKSFIHPGSGYCNGISIDRLPPSNDLLCGRQTDSASIGSFHISKEQGALRFPGPLGGKDRTGY